MVGRRLARLPSRQTSSADGDGRRRRPIGSWCGACRSRGGGKSPRVLLDACVSGPPILKDSPPASFSWLVWPGSSEPQLLLLNRNSSGSVRLGSVKLVELDKGPASPPVRLPKTPATRTMGLYLTGSHPLDRFGAAGQAGLTDNLEIARNLASYVSFCSAFLVVLPERLSDALVVAASRARPKRTRRVPISSMWCSDYCTARAIARGSN